jgi:competence ComEA-like helix-hairpin-helix protein
MRFPVSNFFSGLFSASGKEVGGVLVLAILIILVGWSIHLLDRYTSTGYQDYEADSLLLDSLIASMEYQESAEPAAQSFIDYFTFDPNKASMPELLSLGLDTVIAARIIKYRTKGGVFRQKSDLQKIYGLSTAQYNNLYGYIDLPVTFSTKGPMTPEQRPSRTIAIKKDPERPVLIEFDLNLADTAILQTVNGIGPILSNRIVTFRDKLGGFVDPNQLYQVYNLDSTVILRLKNVCFIAPEFQPKLINLNTSAVEEIAAHPYIKWKQARLLVAYRAQHGPFKEADDLIKVYSIDHDLVEKITPYISFGG